MAITMTPYPFTKPTFPDNNGDPAVGHLLFSYVAGTTTLTSTYSDSAGTAANTNPIVLDAAGRASIYLDPTVSYKFKLCPVGDTGGTSPIWTEDNVSPSPLNTSNVDVSGVAGESISPGNACFLSLGDGALTAGRWYLCDKDTDYKSYFAEQVGFAHSSATVGTTTLFRTSGTVQNLSGLVGGTVYSIGDSGALATASSLNSTHQRYIGVAKSTTELILSQWLLAAADFQPDSIVITAGIKGGAALTSGVVRYLSIPYGFYCDNWVAVADQSGSQVWDVWVDTYANALPTNADTITASAKPTISAAVKGTGSCSTWTRFIPAGSVIGFNLDSTATIVHSTLVISGYRVV